MTQKHSLTGLDAQNPLGFLAALGLLRVLDEHAVACGAPRPTLAYTPDGATSPTLGSHLSLDEVIAQVLDDAQNQATNPAVQFAYNQAGERVHGEARMRSATSNLCRCWPESSWKNPQRPRAVWLTWLRPSFQSSYRTTRATRSRPLYILQLASRPTCPR